MKEFNLEAAIKGAPIQMADGRSVKFVAYVSDAVPAQRVIIKLEDGAIWLFYEDGRWSDSEPYKFDLKMSIVKHKREGWINVYEYGGDTIHETKNAADRGCRDDRIACVPITYEWES